MKPFYTKVTTDYDPSVNIRYSEAKDFDQQWHFHDEYELVYINKSRGVRYVGDHVGSYEEGDLVLLGSKLPHTWINDKNDDPESISATTIIHFQHKFIHNEFFHLPIMKEAKQLFERSKKGILFNPIENIESKLKTIIENNGLLKISLVMDLLFHLSQSKDKQILSSDAYTVQINDNDEKLAKIYNYILQNFRSKITLDEVAAMAHLTPQAFCNYFKSKSRKTVFEYINELRIGFSCRLLMEQKLTIEQIASESGFNNTTFYNRKFKERIGLTPKEYRNKYRFST